MSIKAICAITIPQFPILRYFLLTLTSGYPNNVCGDKGWHEEQGGGAEHSGKRQRRSTPLTNNTITILTQGVKTPPRLRKSEFHGSCEIDKMSDEEFNDYPEVSDQSYVLLLCERDFY